MSRSQEENDQFDTFTLRGKRKKWNGHLKRAIHTIRSLIVTAYQIYQDQPLRAVSHITKARRIAMQFNIRIPRRLKRLYCSHCLHPLIPGQSARLRINHGKVTIYCRNCSRYTRIPLPKGQTEKNRHINK